MHTATPLAELMQQSLYPYKIHPENYKSIVNQFLSNRKKPIKHHEINISWLDYAGVIRTH